MRKFRTELRNARLACFVAQLACGLGWWAAGLLLLAVLAALTDWAFVLSDDAREGVRRGFAVGGACLLLPVLWQAWRTAQRLPAELDALNDDPRRTVSCALHMPATQDSDLAGWLAGQALQQASVAVKRARRHSPALKRWLFALLVPALSAAVLIGLYSASPAAFSTLAARLLQPHRDVPPYSPYHFILQPSKPQVHYGEDLALSCRIEGGELPPAEVCLLLRVPGMPVQQLPTFTAQDGSRVRVLEKVTAPCDIAFATADGRARSHFVPVTVNYSPRILSGRAVITPLPYTGEAEKQVPLGGNEVLVPDGGTVRFELTCSTDIARAYGLFTPAGQTTPQRLQGSVQGKTVSLSMPVRTPGTLSMQVVDAAGREADAPVQTRLSVLPDMPPSVTVKKPEDGSYLVVGHPLEVEVQAEDDYGLSRFSLFKALAPYRQHGVSVLQAPPRTQTFAYTYDTAALCLKPGDKLELRSEVGDDNPFRFNIVSSPTTTVQVISAEDYAEILQMELTYNEFLARYEALEDALDAARRALEAGDTEAARRAMEHAAELARTFAKDFPVFDMDGELSTLSAKLADVLEENLRQLSAIPAEATPEQRREATQQMLERLNGQAAELAPQTREARLVALLARAAEAQQRFMQLVQSQQLMESTFRRFMDEFGAASTSEPGRLEGLGAEQSGIMHEYVAWEESLSPLLEELGQYEELRPMYQQIFAMRHACEQAGVEGLMDQAAAEAEAHHPADAHSYAAKALAAMRELLQKECSQGSCNNASEQCRNAMGSSAGNTLQQLLNAMKGNKDSAGPRPGHGTGSGNGTSARPNPRGGQLMGPSRSRMRGAAGRGKAPANSKGNSASSPQQDSPQHRAVGSPSGNTASYPDAVPEQVPPAYRDAVRSYFSY